jgi:hypothetical protein
MTSPSALGWDHKTKGRQLPSLERSGHSQSIGFKAVDQFDERVDHGVLLHFFSRPAGVWSPTPRERHQGARAV